MDGTSPTGAILYVTASPCYDCAKDLIRVGIKKVYYGLTYQSRYGLSDNVSELLKTANIEMNHLSLCTKKIGMEL